VLAHHFLTIVLPRLAVVRLMKISRLGIHNHGNRFLRFARMRVLRWRHYE
jgi:hypothetical protein